MHCHQPARKARGTGSGKAKPTAARQKTEPARASTGRGARIGPAVAMRSAIQTKLVVGQRGDSYEREADKVAERVASGQPAGDVSRIPAGGLKAQRQEEDTKEPAAQTAAQRQGDTGPNTEESKPTPGAAAPAVQRQAEEGGEGADSGGESQAQSKCAACEGEEKSQRKEDESESKAQKQDEGEGGEAQTKESEPDKNAQKKDDDTSDAAQTAKPDEGAQTQRKEENSSEEAAQTKCAACEEKSAQKKDDEASSSGMAQRQSDEAGDAAQAKKESDEGAVQRQGQEGDESEEEQEEEPEGVEDEDARAPDCDAAEGGGGGGGGAEGEEEEEEAPESEGKDESLGCGEEGEGGGAEAPAAAGGESCGAGPEAGAEAGGEAGGEGGPAAAPAPGTTQAPAVGGSVPGCGHEVEGADVERPEAASTESAPEPGGGEGGGGGGAAPGGECAPTQRKEEDNESEPAQTRDDPREREGLRTREASRLIQSRGTGEPLAPTIRHRLEHSLGVDVKGVRVHADGNAQAASRALRAKAFTHRNHIFLGAGQSQHDLGLMAHEGTHVLQQDAIARRKPSDETARDTRPAGPAASPSSALALAAGAGRSGAPGAEQRATAAAPRATGAMVPAGAAGSSAPTAPPPPGAAAGSPAAAQPGADRAAKTGAATAKSAAPASERAARGSGGGGRGGRGAGAAASAAGPSEEGVDAGPDPIAATAAHPGAAAAAAARKASDRQRSAVVKKRLAAEAFKQKGPAATRPRQASTSRLAAQTASAAAPSPEAEPRSIADEAHMTTLTGAKKEPLKEGDFLKEVEARLDKLHTPRTLGDMDDFKENGGAAELKAGLDSAVDREAAGSKQQIQSTLDSPPKPPKKREAADLDPIPATPRSSRLGAAEVAPAPRAEEEVSLEPNREAVEADLERNRLTKERLEKANDPRFTAVQKARENVHEHADRAPAQFRKQETATIAVTERQMKGSEAKATAGMRQAHTVGQVTARLHQGGAILREAEERRRVASDIEGIYKKAEKAVRAKLDWLAGKDGELGEVDRRFNFGETFARESFEEFVDEGMSKWKLDRYGGRASIPLIGGLLAAGTWVYDKLAGIDDHPDVIKIFDDGRDEYLKILTLTIRGIASIVDRTLLECEQIIAAAEGEIKAYVAQKGLRPSLAKVAKQTAASVFERFGELREDVNSTREELVDRLVENYKSAQEGIDERIKELQAENRGLVEKFVDKLKEIIAAIRNFRNKIGPILAEAGDVIDEIIDDPIGFLGNLLDAVSLGFNQFKSRIDEHLKKGVIAWLFGTLSSAGVEVPKDFSAKAIGGMLLSVLGLTYDKLKTRATRMIGPRAAGVIEKVTDYLSTTFREGPAGLWAEIQQDVGDLKDRIIDEVKSWLITRIITAAVKKVAMMFNPVGAIIQAVITIYNVIMFFIENIERILELVRTVVRAAALIVRGKIQAAADKIEDAMGQTIPLILSFLARLLGIGGIAEKVRSVIGRFKQKIDRAVTKFLRKLVAKLKKGAARAVAKGKKTIAAIAEWWKKKRVFKVGQKTHTMYFEGDRVMVRSEARTISDLVKEHKQVKAAAGQTKKGQEEDLGALYREALELEKAVIRMKKRDSSEARKSSGGLTPQEAKKFDKLLADVRKLLADIQAKSDRPESIIEYRSAVGGLGEHSEAVLLTIKAKERGSPPTPAVGKQVWEHVSKRRSKEGSYYEKAHLISRDFHGKGSAEQNIAPMWRKSNQQFEEKIESPVKDRAFTQGVPVRLDVKAKYDGTHHAKMDRWLKQIDTLYKNKPKAERDAAKDIVRNEKKLPDAMVATATELKLKGGVPTGAGKTLFSNRRVPNVFPANPPQPDEAKAKEKPSLSRSTYRELKDAGVAEEFALLIAKVADASNPWSSFAAFRRRINKEIKRPKDELSPHLQKLADLKAWTAKNLVALAPKVPGEIDL